MPGIFRLAGDGTRIGLLIKQYNAAPLYGDSCNLEGESIHTLTGFIKRYVRDLPEPLMSSSLFSALHDFCCESSAYTISQRISTTILLLQLTPPVQFSVLVYLLAFLGQLPLFPENRLNIDSISIIFGPALCAPRDKGIPGLGSASAGPDVVDQAETSTLVTRSQNILGWLLRHWGDISERVLEPEEDDSLEPSPADQGAAPQVPQTIDPSYQSPIRIPAPSGTTHKMLSMRPGDSSDAVTETRETSSVSMTQAPTLNLLNLADIPLLMEGSLSGDILPPQRKPSSSSLPRASDTSTRHGRARSKVSLATPMDNLSPPSASAHTRRTSSRLIARAFSNISLRGSATDAVKTPKRSASFQGLSMMVKRPSQMFSGAKSGSLRSSVDIQRAPSIDSPFSGRSQHLITQHGELINSLGSYQPRFDFLQSSR